MLADRSKFKTMTVVELSKYPNVTQRDPTPNTHLGPFSNLPNALAFIVVAFLSMSRLLAFVTKRIVHLCAIHRLANDFPPLHGSIPREAPRIPAKAPRRSHPSGAVDHAALPQSRGSGKTGVFAQGALGVLGGVVEADHAVGRAHLEPVPAAGLGAFAPVGDHPVEFELGFSKHDHSVDALVVEVHVVLGRRELVDRRRREGHHPVAPAVAEGLKGPQLLRMGYCECTRSD